MVGTTEAVLQLAPAPAPAHAPAHAPPPEPDPEQLLALGGAHSLALKQSSGGAGGIPVAQELVAAAAESGGVPALIRLMDAHGGDAEFVLWSLDALAGLCAGHPERRRELYELGGVARVLAAMRLLGWEDGVQMKAMAVLTSLAADYPDFVGRSGAVEAVVAGVYACPEVYQVLMSGMRALQVLAMGAEANRRRAVAAGAVALLREALERNPEDGQLQWRGLALLKLLELPDPEPEPAKAQAQAQTAGAPLAAASSATASAAGGSSRSGDGAAGAAGMRRTSLSAQSSWSKVRSTVFKGHARKVAAGNVPGLHGISAQVAERAARPDAVVAVTQFLREHRGYHEAEQWCCDALSTLMTGNGVARAAAVEAGAVALVLGAMRGAKWDEDVQLKATWALLALAGDFAAEVGGGDGMRTIVEALLMHRHAHALQVAGVKLVSLLTVASARGGAENLAAARAANAVKIIKACISAHASDAQLQYRGINLIERLEPGSSHEMPRLALLRSDTMRTDELSNALSGRSGSTGAGSDAESSSKLEQIAEVAEGKDELGVESEKATPADVGADVGGASPVPPPPASSTAVG
jgi:hypothetical protein